MKKIKEYIPLLATAILIICFTVFVMTTDLTGAKGDIGAMGVQGIQGIQGEKGDKGDKGDTGDVGATGATGAQGEQGIQGEKGDKGDTGDVGATGATGAQGEQGIQGEKGDKGDTGDVGATGAQGIQGEPGATGAQGEQGIQGEKGDPGVMSTEPLAGDSGISFEYAEVIKFDASTVSGTILHTPGSENIVIMSPGRYVVSFGVYIDGFLGEVPENAVAGFAITANTGLYLPVFSVLPYGEITGTFIIDATAVSEFSPIILSIRCVSTCETNLANVSKQAYFTCYSFDGTSTITAFLNKAS